MFRLGVVVCCCALALGCGEDSGPPEDGGTERDSGPSVCAEDRACADGIFCNGEERCAPDDDGADEQGCVAAENGPCMEEQICDEVIDRCTTVCDVTSDADGDGSIATECGGDDCDDADPNRFPGNAEICDPIGHDEDCDPTTLGEDRDGDGFVASFCCNVGEDGLVCGEDCDDTRSGVSPGGTEACNGLDDDCDGTVDEEVKLTFYRDVDGDGFGVEGETAEACSAPLGFTLDSGDCDDSDRNRNPGAPEVCSGIDNDCDGTVDEGVHRNFYADADGDGFGDPATATLRDCSPAEGLVTNSDDCDDSSDVVFPGAAEICDGLDNDCSGYREVDRDEDGHLPPDAPCGGGPLPKDDCDDRDALVYGGAEERCDGVDNDCDGVIDQRAAADPWCDTTLTTADGICGPLGCAPIRCDEGYADCDGDWANGCEADLLADADNCGACGVGCRTGSCEAGLCTDLGVVQVATSPHATSCVRTAAGRAVCWGNDVTAAGNVVLPTPIEGFTGFAGIDTACGFTTDGEIHCFEGAGGTAAYDATVAGAVEIDGRLRTDTGLLYERTSPGTWTDTGASSVVRIEGECAVLGDGTAACAPTNPPSGPVAQASVGPVNDCATLQSGAVECWGENYVGELGDGTTDPATDTPTPVTGLSTAVHTEVGEVFTCSLTAQGAVYCWGDNTFGQLGQGDFETSTVPLQVMGLGRSVELDVGQARYACARQSTGAVYCWGDNRYAQLGDGTLVRRELPVRSIPSDVAQVWPASAHTCARRTTGEVVCWGQNAFGQLGDGGALRSPDELFPKQTLLIDDAIALGGGQSFSCALRSDGTAWCWGSNSFYGRLGDDGPSQQGTPGPVTGITDAVAIGSGLDHSCVVHVDGTISCWGRSSEGQLGDGATDGGLTPVPVSGLDDAIEVDGGAFHTCARRLGGLVSCWGGNGFGQLGDGTTDPHVTPEPVSTIDDAVDLAVGSRHACVVRSDRTVWCWGENEFGQIGPTGSTVSTPLRVEGLADVAQVVAGDLHTCALKTDGTVECWGDNFESQLGDGTTDARPFPEPVIGVTDAIAIAGEMSHTCALVHPEGEAPEVHCWGMNDDGQIGDGTRDDAGAATETRGF